ncbi:GvpL/GvpF family gas vesicle protein [Micromonospora sp. 15K316]|uniref:GvpL/GvpF family gas vesicle protein n=1 Tax=Micromonospora sp. 15K316 TaxID=2530376 RepID=UPI0010447C6E|nr:GvpL/GvpF family gas vesicle protein [Micromonospora sp. 15K316]TDC32743.1 GvpL/GvpF family gas vesicle protein [Micromonospora sp. 15K316]
MSEQDGLFLYGIVPSDVEPTPGTPGVGDPPGEVTVVRQGPVAALVSEVTPDAAVGRPADLTTYQMLLDGTAAVAPVLPVRFGTVVAGPGAVRELLDAQGDRFAAELDELEGRVQYVVHGRYDEPELIRRVLDDNPAAATLADQVRGQPEGVTREQRIRLGEYISRAVELRRDAESRELLDALAPLAVSGAHRPPSHELDAANVAFLVDADREDEFVDAVEEFAEQRRGLVRMRLLGPLAPYDFTSADRVAR